MNHKITKEKTIKLIFAIGNNLILDLGDESKKDWSMEQYGEYILEKYPDLLLYRNFNKGGTN